MQIKNYKDNNINAAAEQQISKYNDNDFNAADEIQIRKYTDGDLAYAISLWNEIVAEGNAFPQEEPLDEISGAEFFASQSYVGVAEVNGKIVGLYILHPNNVGRCGHIANASYAVSGELRGKRIGERLVTDCLEQAKRLCFRILQFNAVVESNEHARRLYEKLNFNQLGTIDGGFRMKDGRYVNICPYWRAL